MASNGEVEGPPRGAEKAPRAHTVLQRPRRLNTDRLSASFRRGAAFAKIVCKLTEQHPSHASEMWRSGPRTSWLAARQTCRVLHAARITFERAWSPMKRSFAPLTASLTAVVALGQTAPPTSPPQ